MKHLPQVTKARYEGDFTITATFDDGSVKTIDLSKWLKGPVFKPLKRKDFFKKFFVDGGTICWPNGADIAPETLFGARQINAVQRGKERKKAPKRRGA